MSCKRFPAWPIRISHSLCWGHRIHTAIMALVLYALLPMLRNTVTGILNVDVDVRDSATALGMTAAERLREVELPLAAATILAGVRIAAVTTIGTATIAAAIGAGGLGVFIFARFGKHGYDSPVGRAIPAAPWPWPWIGGWNGSNVGFRNTDSRHRPCRLSA